MMWGTAQTGRSSVSRRFPFPLVVFLSLRYQAPTQHLLAVWAHPKLAEKCWAQGRWSCLVWWFGGNYSFSEENQQLQSCLPFSQTLWHTVNLPSAWVILVFLFHAHTLRGESGRLPPSTIWSKKSLDLPFRL